ncbi:MAG: ornithine carbamoyltransferase [Polyangiales bacterium]
MNARRDFLRLLDLSLGEARALFAEATLLAADRRRGHDRLAGRAVALVMEKASTRTRISFEVGVAQLGGHPVIVTAEGTQLARGEPLRDTARVLSGYCDAIVFRTSTTTRLDEMASFSRVPVINALTDDGHPVQVLADVFTAEEALGRSLQGARVAWVGDGSSNMARSWIEAARLFDFHLAIAAPTGFQPPPGEVEAAGDRVSLHPTMADAIAGAAVVNTDVWTSMGQEAESARRLAAFAGWTLTEAALAGARHDAIVLHCLPAHRGEEIDEATLEGARARVWKQAENRLHVQKALVGWVIGVGGA